MRIIDAIPLIEAHLDANIPVMLEGPTGVGKSALMRQLADRRGWPFSDKFRASTLDPTVDIHGIPSIVDGRTVFNPPDAFPRVDRDGPVGLVFLDEIDTGTMAVQAAMFGLVYDRFGLPEGWRIAAARNGSKYSRASGRLSQPLSARFGRIEIDYDVGSWCQWAIEHDIVPEIIAYHRWADSRDQQMLFRMPEPGDESQFPTGRGWEGVSDLCKVAPAMAFQHAVAKCGMAAAVDFKGFLEVYRELPRLQDIVDDPRGARVPVEPGQLYAVSGMLGKQATSATLKPIVAYVKRLPVEFSVMAITDAIRRVPELKQAPGFTDWAASSQAVTL